MGWLIDWNDITFVSSGSAMSAMEFGTRETSFSSKLNVDVVEPKHIDKENSADFYSGVKIGIYKGMKIQVRFLPDVKIEISKSFLIEVTEMKEISHENIIHFVGLCSIKKNAAIITYLASRGTLRDMLDNSAMDINWMLRFSIITDIIEGMTFLHGSAINYHGRLRSNNCFIDRRYVIKLSDFGLQQLYKQVPETSEDCMSYLWIAPEHLRQKNPFQTGSKKGDVYSFSIILQEIITKKYPYVYSGRNAVHFEPFDVESTLDKLRLGLSPPHRPVISADDASPEILNLTKMCWKEKPEDRPSFVEIKTLVKRINRGVSGKNLLDKLLKRMEKYANDLEYLVSEKIKLISEEKKKADELLYQMIPRFIAEQLKTGSSITPETYDSVTILFSDIVDFIIISAKLTPLQVVDLLNNLYSYFDSVIDSLDVYKVESIGDEYMVASGLPVRNGYEHAKEIAHLAIHLLNSISAFHVNRTDYEIQLRIGIHSGPCVAGIVGLKTPRFCLFGDTVNVASRMKSTSESLKIHISRETKEILDRFGGFKTASRGKIQVKGRGLMETYFLESEITDMNKSYIKGISYNPI